MTNLISNAGILFTGMISNVGTVASTITGEPLLLVFVAGIPLAFLGVRMFKRLMNSGRG